VPVAVEEVPGGAEEDHHHDCLGGDHPEEGPAHQLHAGIVGRGPQMGNDPR
jgi:hypothetical protein